MKNTKMGKKREVKSGVNPALAAAAGAVVGAGIAVAGVMLSDEKNRKKIIKASKTVKDDVTNFIKKTQKQLETDKNKFQEKMTADKLKVKKVVTSAKNSVHDTTKKVNDAVKSL